MSDRTQARNGQELTERRAAMRPAMSIRRLAKLTGLHRATLYKLEAGQQRPERATASRLAAVYNVPPDTVAAWCGGYAHKGRRGRSTSRPSAPAAGP